MLRPTGPALERQLERNEMSARMSVKRVSTLGV
jgi:hypothetical protein